MKDGDSILDSSVGDHVRIQNQVGNHPNQWDKTGVVVVVRQYHQYVIRVDGSGRITIRNRRLLRKYIPAHQPDRKRTILDDLRYLPTSNPSDQLPPTPTTPTDVPIHPNASSNSPNKLPATPPSPTSIAQRSPTALTTPPCPLDRHKSHLQQIPLLYHHPRKFNHSNPVRRFHHSHLLMLTQNPLQSSYDILHRSENPHNGTLQVTTFYIKYQSLPYFL